MERARTVEELRLHGQAWRDLGNILAIVPTMGALHAGHLSLVEEARSHADKVMVSIFVNPTQFAPDEDFAAYPRDIEGDMKKLSDAGVDLVFTPSVEVMYPQGFATTMHVEGPARAGLEDAFRPTHFDGVATVVAKLFIQSQADVAVFGEKDYQQLQVIRRMARDLDIPVKVIGAPTMREEDGLAMSSRNAYLSPKERARAPALHAALQQARSAILAGEPISQACAGALEQIEKAGFRPDYLEARHAETLDRVGDDAAGDTPLRLLAAARLGKTRLIDNIPL